MHELWLCKNILEIVNQKLIGHNCARVTAIYLEVGQLIGIEKELLLFNFDLLMKGTKAQHAHLQINEIPGKAVCETCKKTINIHQYADPCPCCGSFVLAIIEGEELRVKSMEVE